MKEITSFLYIKLIFIRNCKEIIENRVNFTKEVYGYAKFKGYNLSYIETITSEDVEIEKEFNNLSKEKKIEDRNKLVDNILNTEVITKEDYNILSNKKNLTNNDFYKIEKYNFVKCYNVQSDKCNYDFIMKYYDKNLMKQYKNITTILNSDIQSTNDKLSILKQNHLYNNNYNSYTRITQTNYYIYHYNVNYILKILGFDINKRHINKDDNKDDNEDDNNSIKDDDNFFEKLKLVSEWLINNKTEIILKYNIIDININNIDINDKQKFKNKILTYINKILKNFYGFSIKKINKSYKLCENDILYDIYINNIKNLELRNAINDNYHTELLDINNDNSDNVFDND